VTIDWDEKKTLLQEPNIAAVTQLCDELMEKKPGSVVPYIDPVHDEDECRIVSLHIAPGKGKAAGGSSRPSPRGMGTASARPIRPGSAAASSNRL